MIIRGGANVYPAEVERVLLEAPGVVASAVIGVPDERLGERVVAVVEADSIDEASVRAHCVANLAKYKVPERFVRGRPAAPQRHGQDHPHGAGRPPVAVSVDCMAAWIAALVAATSSVGLNMRNSLPAAISGTCPGVM